MVTDDVTCHGCRYNLRGLPEVGRCPECGGTVRVSLDVAAAAARRFRPDLSRATPAHRRRWAQGLACVVASAGVTNAVALLPEGLRQPHTRAWPVLLGVAVVGWVLTPLGIWWASPSDPAVDESPGMSPWRWAAACILTALFPGVAALTRVTRDHDYGWALLPCGIALVMTAGGFYPRLRRLAQAAGSTVIAGQCVVFGALIPMATLGVCGLTNAGESGRSSLDLVLSGPNPAFGSAGMIVFGLSGLVSGENVAFGLIALPLPLWSAVVVGVLLVRLLTPAAGPRNTAPSSRP